MVFEGNLLVQNYAYVCKEISAVWRYFKILLLLDRCLRNKIFILLYFLNIYVFEIINLKKINVAHISLLIYDTHIKTEITDIFFFGKKILKFLLGEQEKVLDLSQMSMIFSCLFRWFGCSILQGIYW